jgi:hypothetical protein
VVDRSALLSYALGHVHVGELLREIADEPGAVVAVPSLALLQAHADLFGRDRLRAVLRVVTTLPGVEVLTVDESAADHLAGVATATAGDLSKAHVVWAVNQHHAWLLTTEPGEVAHLVPDEDVIPIPTEDG